MQQIRFAFNLKTSKDNLRTVIIYSLGVYAKVGVNKSSNECLFACGGLFRARIPRPY